MAHAEGRFLKNLLKVFAWTADRCSMNNMTTKENKMSTMKKNQAREDRVVQAAQERILEAFRESNGGTAAWNVAVMDQLARMHATLDRLKSNTDRDGWADAMPILERAMDRVRAMGVKEVF